MYRYDCVMARSYERGRSTAAGILALARLKAGLSQGQLGARAGVPATMISAYERDKRQPTLPTLERLLRAAGYELRMHLEPVSDHDDVLAAHAPATTARHARHVEKWRQADQIS